MKRFLLLLALLAGFLLPARAQDFRHEVNLSAGFMPRIYLEIENAPGYSGDLASIYEPRVQAEGMPLFGVDYAYAVLRWLKLGGEMDFTHIHGLTRELYRNTVVNEFSRYAVYLMPQAKVFAVDIPHFKVYAKLALGMNLNLGTALVDPVQLAWSVTPLGLQWAGDRVFGTLELTNGNVLQGVRLGVGFRF